MTNCQTWTRRTIGVMARAWGKMLGSVVLGSVLAACHGIDASGVASPLTSIPYLTLRVNVRAAVMSTVAPYDTLQLTATAYNDHGLAIPDPGPVSYKVSDTALAVSATGLLTAKHVTGSNSFVVVSMRDTSLNVTHADTAYILATSVVPAQIANFSMQPSEDSAIIDVKNAQGAGMSTGPISLVAQTSSGTVIPSSGIVARFTSSDVTIASVDARTGVVTAVYPGSVMISVSTSYYGQLLQDSLAFRVGYPDLNNINIPVDNTNPSHPDTLPVWIIGRGKTVVFSWQSVMQTAGARLSGMDIEFDDPTGAQLSPNTTAKGANGAGNIGPITFGGALYTQFLQTDSSNYLSQYCNAAPYPCAAKRAFPTLGTYHYHSNALGFVGEIQVIGP